MNNPLFLLIGKSASGKTTIANMLEQQLCYKQVYSYTTRKPRYHGEIGHVFVSNDEFDALGEMVAYTEYNGNRYGTTAEQLDQCQIYVVDVPGVATLLKRYNTYRPIVTIYFDTTTYTRINRMLERGDGDMMIISRLLQDEKDDWCKQLEYLINKYSMDCGRNVYLHKINANGDLQQVLDLVRYYIEKHVEG